MKKVLILGYGISGQAAARLAQFNGDLVTILDEQDPAVPDSMERIPFWTPDVPLQTYDYAVISPGISIFSPLADAVRKSGTPILGELEFAAQDLPCKLAAITGTNGKTTTTELTTALFQWSGFRCESAGNIGTALSDVALELKKGLRKLDLLIVETSSFQLESMNSYAPDAAAILNLASDHINRHGSMEGYADAKFRIFRNMSADAPERILNFNLLPEWEKRGFSGTPATFSADNPSADFYCKDGTFYFRGNEICKRSLCQLEGAHNTENVLAALALFRAIAGDDALFSEQIRETIGSFRPDRHRLECFAEQNGIRYIDDSKATNPHSVTAALRTLGGDKNVLLLLGGSDKDMDFRCIAEDRDKIKHAYLYGQTAKKIYQTLKDPLPCTVMESFEDAVETACRNAVPGDLVMLSPACASFDLFKSYKARGDRFQELVRQFLQK